MTNELAFRLRPNSMEKYSKSKNPVRADRRLGIRMTAEKLNVDKEIENNRNNKSESVVNPDTKVRSTRKGKMPHCVGTR
jgi:hypothetical protein